MLQQTVDKSGTALGLICFGDALVGYALSPDLPLVLTVSGTRFRAAGSIEFIAIQLFEYNATNYFVTVFVFGVSDVVLLAHFVGNTNSLRHHDQNWVPICLPKFNSQAFLQVCDLLVALRLLLL